MSCRRVFIDWKAPCLHSACALLLKEHTNNNLVDLSAAIIILPSKRAGRRVIEIFALESEAKQLELIPPRCITVGSLHEFLYAPELSFASDEVKTLAWIESVKNSDLLALGFKQIAPRTITEALPVARLISSLYQEVGRAASGFLEIAQKCEKLILPGDESRWHALDSIEKKYHSTLKKWGYIDPQAVMLTGKPTVSNYMFYLIGVTELAKIHRAILPEATAFIYAPESEAKKFDDFGCVVPAAFESLNIPIENSAISFAASPQEEALLVAKQISEANKSSTDELTIAGASTNTIQLLVDTLNACALNCYDPAGATFKHTTVGSLLQLLNRYLISSLYKDFAAFIRHPTIIAWSKNNEIVGTLDRYYTDHLPYTYDISGHITEALLSPFFDEQLSLSEWCKRIGLFIATVFERNISASDSATFEALILLRESLESLDSLPEQTIDAVDALALLFDLANDAEIPLTTENEIPVLGWLELLLDDSRTLYLTGLNEGNIPAPFVPNPFLSDSMRQALGIETNRTRLARDTYILYALTQSRTLNISASHTSVDGETLTPSRLLYKCDDQTLIQRVESFATVRSIRGETSPVTFFKPPEPEILQPIKELNVSSLADYITCPYRFYLKHIRKLRTYNDLDNELTPLQIGSLMHKVLERSLAQSAEPTNDQLVDLLNHLLTQQFGDNVIPSVYLQRESLVTALAGFSKWQKEQVAGGWRTVATEYEIRLPLNDYGLAVDLVARIDRIDYNATTNEALIIDYKVSARPVTPNAAHNKDGEWSSFQLPLYRLMLESTAHNLFPKNTTLTAAYVTLAETTSDRAADWGDAMFAEANRRAFEVIGNILALKFTPPKVEVMG